MSLGRQFRMTFRKFCDSDPTIAEVTARAGRWVRTLVGAGKVVYDSRNLESAYVPSLKRFQNCDSFPDLPEGHRRLFQPNILGGINV